MDKFVELIKWCFRDENSGLATVIVLIVIFAGIIGIIRAFKEK